MNDTTYQAVTQHLWLNESGHGVDYTPEGEDWAVRQYVIDVAFRDLGHDDFNIATLHDGQLVAFGSGMDDFGPDEDGSPHGGHDLAEIAGQCGWKA